MIRIDNISKSFGGQKLFENACLAIHQGERVGLVGRNGHGKTTLFRIVLGLEEVDSGEVVVPKNYHLGIVAQELKFSESTILAEGCLGLPKRYCQETWRVEKTLDGLGFSRADLQRHPNEFSGGFQVRLNLAKVLVSEPDLLLLDEPTNYLDVVSIRWLAKTLKEWKGELCLITHDRSFMDAVVTHVAAIHARTIRKLKGTTQKLYDMIEQEEEVHEKTRLNQEKKRKEAELYVARFRAKARLASNVQSRIKALAKETTLEKLETIKTINFSFGFEPTGAKTLLTANRLRFGYLPNKNIIEDFNLSVGRCDRICVIGHNGKGKTTLLRLLVGDLTPGSGEVHLHNQTVVGYFAQTNIAKLHADWTVEEELMGVGCEKQRARGIAGAMLFEGELAEKKIKVLSGGEKSRVLLGRILAQNSNLLLLDEPTNHLDMQSGDAFLLAVERFPGAVVMVTHNEMFLHRLANRFVVFQEDRIDFFEGSYADFLEKVGWAKEAQQEPTSKAEDLALKKINTKKELRRKRAELIARSSRELKPLKSRIEELEQKIMEAEERIEVLNEEMISKVKDSGRDLGQLAKEGYLLKRQIDSWFLELEQISMEHERKAREIDRELSELDSVIG